MSFLQNNVSLWFNEHVPLKQKTTCNDKPWFNEKNKNLIKKRDVAFSRWKRFKTSDLRCSYKNSRNIVNSEIVKAKKSFMKINSN